MSTSTWIKKPSRPLYLLLVGALLVLAAWAFWPRPQAVEAAQVERRRLTVTFTEEGRTRLRDRYEVSAPVDGVVERIVLRPGDRVKAGIPVAVLLPANAALLDPAARSEAQARWRAADEDLDAANSATAAARAVRQRREAARRRAESLASTSLIAADQLDEIRAQAVAAQADLDSAQARAQAARIRRDTARAILTLQGSAARSGGGRLPLPSPIDGQVIRRFVESAGFVRAGQALVEMGDPTALEVVVEALTLDAVRIAPGTRVQLLRWGGDAPLSGHVRSIEPGGFTKTSALGVEEQRVLIVIAFDDPRHRALGDGYRVEAEFEVWSADDVLVVPNAALFRDDADWAVYRIEDGRARMRHVRLGQRGDDAAQVLEGLAEGERVVMYPGDNLRDGMAVEAQDH